MSTQDNIQNNGHPAPAVSDADVSNVVVTTRPAKDDEKPDPTSVVEVQEVRPLRGADDAKKPSAPKSGS
jgi:hypothetical protein